MDVLNGWYILGEYKLYHLGLFFLVELIKIIDNRNNSTWILRSEKMWKATISQFAYLYLKKLKYTFYIYIY